MKSLITPYNFLLFTLTLFSFTVNGQQSNSTTVNPDSIADPVIKVVDYGGLIPCVEELPHFMAVDGKYRGNKKYKMILVSLDDAEKANGTVKNFAKRLKLDVDHYLLDDIKKMNEWIPSVDKSWSGSIPATLFIKNGKSLQFVENSLSMDELESIIKLHL